MPLPAAAFPCCRAHDLFTPVEKYPVDLRRTPGDEAYWFGWGSTNHGTASSGFPGLAMRSSCSATIDPTGSANPTVSSAIGASRLVATRRRCSGGELLDAGRG